MAMDRETNKKVSIVVPVYNEEENVSEFFSRTERVLNSINYDWEILFVNDGSKDRTEDLIRDFISKNNNVKLINLSRNFGKEAAMTAGIQLADGDAVIIIDADLQDPPELIPELITKWEEGYDVVYGTRKNRKGESWLKKASAKYFYKLISLISEIDIPRDTGDFRLLSRQAIEAVRQLPEHHRFMKGLFSWIGFKQTAVFYERDSRFRGKSKWGYWKLWNFAIEGITSFSYIPLQIMTYIGFIVAILCFLYAGFLVLKTMVWGRDVPGYASLMVALLFLGSIQLIGLGLIGEYLGRCYTETKRRPVCIVKEVVERYQEKDDNAI